MGKLTDDKLDEFFRSKLSDFETEPEENYWPAIEAGTAGPSLSFYSFTWKRFNIYHALSITGVAALLTLWFFSGNTPEDLQKPENIPTVADTVSIIAPAISNEGEGVREDGQTKKRASGRKAIQKQDLQEKPVFGRPIDSVIPPQPVQEEPKPEIKEEPVIKPKPEKRVIYIVEQDTIVEKDTVKVRRKKKK